MNTVITKRESGARHKILAVVLAAVMAFGLTLVLPRTAYAASSSFHVSGHPNSGTGYYSSLDEATKAVADGETITMLSDYSHYGSPEEELNLDRPQPKRRFCINHRS